MAKLLEQISGEEALKILRLLSAQDQDIENRIEEWKKFKLNKNASLKMKSFLNNECNKWAVWALKNPA